MKRIFRVWAYTVSHNTMLIRSVKKNEMEITAKTIDFHIADVIYFDFPTTLTNLEISSTSQETLEKYIEQKNISNLSLNENHQLFKLNCDEGVFHLIALAVKKDLNDDKYFETTKYPFF